MVKSRIGENDFLSLTVSVSELHLGAATTAGELVSGGGVGHYE